MTAAMAAAMANAMKAAVAADTVVVVLKITMKLRPDVSSNASGPSLPSDFGKHLFYNNETCDNLPDVNKP